jgi:hypothetical protein
MNRSSWFNAQLAGFAMSPPNVDDIHRRRRIRDGAVLTARTHPHIVDVGRASASVMLPALPPATSRVV